MLQTKSSESGRPLSLPVNPDARRLKQIMRNYKPLDELRFANGRYHRPRFKNPLVGNLGDVINQPIYDSFNVALNTAFPLTTLFAQPFGQGGKNQNQTNMQLAGQLPPPQKLVIFALRLFISNDTTITDMNNILRNVLITFTVGVKQYFAGPPLFLTAGCGAILSAASQVGTAPAGSAVQYSSTNGSPVQQNVFSLTRPIVIESGETFSLVLNPQTAFNTQAAATNPPGVGTTIYAILDGELYRQVQ